MGRLGALAGFGQGLQDFSKILQKKQEQDWLDQQARVKWEREENLQRFKMSQDNENARLNRDLTREQMTQTGAHQTAMLGEQTASRLQTGAHQTATLDVQKGEAESNSKYRDLQAKIAQINASTESKKADASIRASDANIKESEQKTKESNYFFGIKKEAFDQLSPEERTRFALGKTAASLTDAEVKLAGEQASMMHAELTADGNKKELALFVKRVADSTGRSPQDVKDNLPSLIYMDVANEHLRNKMGGKTQPIPSPSQQKKGSGATYLQFPSPEAFEKARADFRKGELDPQVAKSINPSIISKWKKEINSEAGNDPSYMSDF